MTTPRDTASPAATNGHYRAGALQPSRLTPRQRDQLAGYVSLMDERAMRRALGMTSELLDQALTGRALPPEAVERCVAFLDDGATGLGRAIQRCRRSRRPKTDLPDGGRPPV